MRGEICVWSASVLSLTSLVLLLLVHIGQTGSSAGLRKLSMLKVNASAYSSVLESFIQNPVSALYTSDPNTPLGTQAGLRQYYTFGLYSYCGYVSDTNTSTSTTTNNNNGGSSSSWVNSSATPDPSIPPGRGTCTGTQFAMPLKPYDFITADMLSNYTILSNNFIPDTTFRDSKYLSDTSKAAYWMFLLGTISCFAALVSGIAKGHSTFFLSAIFSLVSAVLLLIASATYTVLIKKCQAINSILLAMANSSQKIPVGIVVDVGVSLFLMWAGCVFMILSVIPYFISCCTWRG